MKNVTFCNKKSYFGIYNTKNIWCKMELTFCELRAKEVVNMCDGKRLGNIIDLVYDSTCGRVLGLVVPAEKTLFSFFKNNSVIFIPYNRIRKIGKDIILVELTPVSALNNPVKKADVPPPKEIDTPQEFEEVT